MRSRYTAHAIGDEAYLHRTFAPTARKSFTASKPPASRTNWIRLVIHGDEAGPSSEVWFVEFSAFHRDGSGEHEMRERSEFRRIEGQWLYTKAMPRR